MLQPDSHPPKPRGGQARPVETISAMIHGASCSDVPPNKEKGDVMTFLAKV